MDAETQLASPPGPVGAPTLRAVDVPVRFGGVVARSGEVAIVATQRGS